MSEAKHLNGYQVAHMLVRITAIVLLVEALDWGIPTVALFISLLFSNDSTLPLSENFHIFIDMLIPAFVKILTFMVLWFGSKGIARRICPEEGQEAHVQVTEDALKSAGVFIVGLALLYVFTPVLITSLKHDSDVETVGSVLVLLIALGMILFPGALVSGLAKIAGVIGRKRNRF